ncbi:MAG: 5-formyltetrahydrofolate cyclo-ligase [Verrucomicrobiae bacterium]|nr:5-formyltetrahydrofolate cyclo-ligase [Verrucomicrobiae bacterium]
MGGVAEAKRALRQAMRERLSGMGLEERRDGSAAVCLRLQGSEEWAGAGVVLGYLALPSEPEVTEAMRAAVAGGRVVGVPRWNRDRGEYDAARWTPDAAWQRGPDGVIEPAAEAEAVNLERLDLVLVPGLAFDFGGRRLGRGRGHFDRLLIRARRARRWGVGFDGQLVAEVPSEPHDVNVQVVVTPGRWWTVKPGGC